MEYVINSSHISRCYLGEAEQTGADVITATRRWAQPGVLVCLLLFIDHLVVHLNPDIEHLVVYCTVGGTWPTAVCPASQAGPYKALCLTPIDPGNK